MWDIQKAKDLVKIVFEWKLIEKLKDFESTQVRWQTKKLVGGSAYRK